MDNLFYLLSNSPFTSEDFLKKLIPNFWSFLIQLIALIVLIVAVVFIAYKPVRRLVEKRRAETEQNTEGARKALKKAEASNKAAQENLQASRKEANQIILDAKKQAEEEKAGLLKAAEEDSKKIKEAALADLETEKRKAEAELRAKASELAVLGAQQLLKSKATSKDDEALVESYLKEKDDE